MRSTYLFPAWPPPAPVARGERPVSAVTSASGFAFIPAQLSDAFARPGAGAPCPGSRSLECRAIPLGLDLLLAALLGGAIAFLLGAGPGTFGADFQDIQPW